MERSKTATRSGGGGTEEKVENNIRLNVAKMYF